MGWDMATIKREKETLIDGLSVDVLRYATKRGAVYGLTGEDLDEMFMTIARKIYFLRTGGERLPDSFTLPSAAVDAAIEATEDES